MTAQDKEEMAATVHEDLTKLIKEYARMGYKVINGRDGKEFEALWEKAFKPDRAKESVSDLRPDF